MVIENGPPIEVGLAGPTSLRWFAPLSTAAYDHCPGAAVVAFTGAGDADRDLARRVIGTECASLGAMRRQGLDAIVLGCGDPRGSSAEALIKRILATHHLLLLPPLALTGPQALACGAEAARNGRVLWVAYEHRPLLAWAAKLAEQVNVGPIEAVSATCLRRRDASEELPFRRELCELLTCVAALIEGGVEIVEARVANGTLRATLNVGSVEVSLAVIASTLAGPSELHLTGPRQTISMQFDDENRPRTFRPALRANDGGVSDGPDWSVLERRVLVAAAWLQTVRDPVLAGQDPALRAIGLAELVAGAAGLCW